jgi:hypothetical protein
VFLVTALVLAASCSCISVPLLRDGAVVCAACSAPVFARGLVDADVYSSANPASYPPGCKNRRQARERIRVVPGHERTGNGPATLWSVNAETYRVHHARKPSAPAKLVLVPTTSDESAVEAALAVSGVRMTKRAAA